MNFIMRFKLKASKRPDNDRPEEEFRTLLTTDLVEFHALLHPSDGLDDKFQISRRFFESDAVFQRFERDWLFRLKTYGSLK